MTTADLVKAIRSDKLVGRGSCTSVDECWEDSELIEALERANITTIDGAVRWARNQEGMFLEQGLNCRWGEDDDEQLLAYNEYQEKRSAR